MPFPTERRFTDVANEIADIRRRLAEIEGDALGRFGMRWRGAWVGGPYASGDVVRDGSWTMVAKRATTERPAPQPTGDPFSFYEGASPTNQATASIITFGNRFTMPGSGFINAWRLYTVAGNVYQVRVRFNPGTPGESLQELANFTADSTGWVEVGVGQSIVTVGTVIDLYASVFEPDPTPTTWVGDWDYDTPNNEGTPAAGVCLHANRGIGTLRFSKTDDGGSDRSAELLALVPGDVIDAVGQRWSVQSAPSDGGTFVEIAIAPAQQGSPDGVATFTFEVVAPTPITYLADPSYWATAPISGQKGFIFQNSGYVDPPTLVDGAYGTDLVVQAATEVNDWDVVGLHEGGGGSGGGGLTEPQADALYHRLDAANTPFTGGIRVESPGGVAIRAKGIGTNALLQLRDPTDSYDQLLVSAVHQVTTRDETSVKSTRVGNAGNNYRFRVYDKLDANAFDVLAAGDTRHHQAGRGSKGAGALIYSGYFTAPGTVLTGSNVDLLSHTVDLTDIPDWGLWGSDHPLMVKVVGVGRANNQANANAWQIRAVAAGNNGALIYSMGHSSTPGGRSGVYAEKRQILAAGTGSIVCAIQGRYFGTAATVDIYMFIDVFIAPSKTEGI